MNFWILSSRLARTRRDLANNSDKKPKIRRKFAKKNSSQKSQNHAKSHRSTQFQTWNLHVNMMNCIARHNFKLRNDSFSYENWGPGIFRSLSLFKMHQKNVLVHALFRDPLFWNSKFASSRNKTINAKMRNFEKRDRRFRGFNKLSESLATWNLLNTLAIV